LICRYRPAYFYAFSFQYVDKFVQFLLCHCDQFRWKRLAGIFSKDPELIVWHGGFQGDVIRRECGAIYDADNHFFE